VDARSKPYFFSFDTESKPGKIIAHCVRVETVEIAADLFDATTFTLFPADFNEDKRLRHLCRSAHSFIVQNKIDPSKI
jgi:hypothetical protein